MEKRSIRVVIDNHDGCDKSFLINVGNKIHLYADYDDVNHAEVDAAAHVIKDILEKHWSNEKFKEYLYDELKKEWDENNEYLHDDYDSFESFLKDRI